MKRGAMHEAEKPTQSAGVGNATKSRPTPIQELLAYRLARVANAISRSAARRYRREFGISIGEWRALALLGATSPLTLNRLARLAALDKAQMSRIVARLTERELTVRRFGAGRTTELSLTRKGQALYRRLIAVANERDDAFLGVLTEHEREVFDTVLDKLGTLALEFERAG
jgi:DNA-binding MarR family transcriptional regulator